MITQISKSFRAPKIGKNRQNWPKLSKIGQNREKIGEAIRIFKVRGGEAIRIFGQNIYPGLNHVHVLSDENLNLRFCPCLIRKCQFYFCSQLDHSCPIFYIVERKDTGL